MKRMLGMSMLGLLWAFPSHADDTRGVTDETILFGQSAAFSGPTQALGRGMNNGILAAFNEANQAGGVHGRQIRLITRDDAYEPTAAVENTRKLIEEDGVFALVGAVGTPTSRAALPVAVEYRVPYIAPFTGATFLREDRTSVVNLRASYFQETEEIVRYLVDDRGITDIAIVYQDDSYGQVGYRGVIAALNRRAMILKAAGVYPRNTTAVKTALLDVRRANPQAIVVIGSYEPTAELILWSRRLEMDTLFFTISFGGSNALATQLGENGDGVFVSQVVPLPQTKELEVARQYRDALAAYDSTLAPGFVSFEGYLAGRMTLVILERVGRELTRQKFMETMRTIAAYDMGGFELRFDQSDNQGSDAVFLTVIGEDGRFHSLTE